MIKRILIFEFITGGGFAQQALPASLANEGMLMLNALVQELAELPSIQLTILQDWRCKQLHKSDNVRSVLVSKDQSIDALLPGLIEEVDAVWLIAPETDKVLLNISQLVEEKSKVLLNSSSEAVALCSDKLRTIQCLTQYEIPVVETVELNAFRQNFDKPWVIKSKDGVGCQDSYYASTQQQFKQLNTQITQPFHYVVQPYVKGDPLSLSCLFKGGQAWLLCCNKQQVSIEQERFELSACIVNIAHDRHILFQRLIDKIANAIPGLWGYVGIDIIQTESNALFVLEINPRLTTSYVGIQRALGINVARLVLDMVKHQPTINPKINKPITISII